MSNMDQLSIPDAATLMVGVGLEVGASIGIIETLESGANYALKAAELGVLTTAVVAGIGGIGYGIDRIRDARRNRNMHREIDFSLQG